MENSKMNMLCKLGILVLLMNGYIFLSGQSQIPEREEGNVDLYVVDEDFINKGLKLPTDGSLPYFEIADAPLNCDADASIVDPDPCINEGGKNPGVRGILFTNNIDITMKKAQITTTTGTLDANNIQNMDAGIFKFFKDDPQVSDQNDARFTKCEFLTSTGLASKQENLQKIINVRPLTSPQIFELLNEKVLCAVSFDSDTNFGGRSDRSRKDDGDVLNGFFTLGLQGSNRGIFAFRIVNVQAHPAGPPRLPIVTYELIPSDQVHKVCERACAPKALSPH